MFLNEEVFARGAVQRIRHVIFGSCAVCVASWVICSPGEVVPLHIRLFLVPIPNINDIKHPID